MDVEMDLISQRSAQDSASGLPSTILSHQHILPDGFDFADSRNGRIPVDGGVLASMPARPSANGTATDSEHNLGYHGSTGDASIFLTQQKAKTSNIVAFAAGSDSYCSSTATMPADVAATGGGSVFMPGNHSLSQMSCAVRNLIGASVTTGAKLVDVDGSNGVFFVFPDLSIRKDGEYRFRFSFFDLKSDMNDLVNTTSYIKARTFSEPFRVYSAKQFPGMIESTLLSKHFAKQGVKIPVRKESSKAQDADYDDWNN
ncbi:hypothetical protein GGI20_004674 [Coemansia sp. BCRC 34301]|nr:hypothetical protein GGI20_004674 [Coemansia sp. BCRC 34301]